jgi:holin-like protein
VREPPRDAGVVRVSEGLLRHLQLLFVPAGVGVVQHLGLLGASAVPVVVGLTVSWLAALVSTAAVAAGLLALGRRRAAR